MWGVFTLLAMFGITAFIDGIVGNLIAVSGLAFGLMVASALLYEAGNIAYQAIRNHREGFCTLIDYSNKVMLFDRNLVHMEFTPSKQYTVKGVEQMCS